MRTAPYVVDGFRGRQVPKSRIFPQIGLGGEKRRLLLDRFAPFFLAAILNRDVGRAGRKNIAVDKIASAAVDLHRSENAAAAAHESIVADHYAADHIVKTHRGLPRPANRAAAYVRPVIMHDLDTRESGIGINVKSALIVAFKHTSTDPVGNDAHIVGVRPDRA